MPSLIKTITTDEFAGQAGVYVYDPSKGTRSRVPTPAPKTDAVPASAAPVAPAPAAPVTTDQTAPAQQTVAPSASDNGATAK